jgi:hypothetical protein
MRGSEQFFTGLPETSQKKTAFIKNPGLQERKQTGFGVNLCEVNDTAVYLYVFLFTHL